MRERLRALRQEKGFTLVELLVVIIIIGILAAVAIPAFLNQRQRANDAAVQSDVKNIATTVETLLVSNPQGSISRSGDGKTLISGAVTEPINTTKGVHWDIYGSQNGYCISGWHDNGKSFTSFSNPLTYNSNTGGVRPRGEACTSVPNSPNGTVISSGGGASEPMTYSWTGTPNNSTSKATNQASIAITNFVTNPSFEVDMTDWYEFGTTNTRDLSTASSGSASLKVVPDGTTSRPHARITAYGLTSGVAYTVTFKVRASVAIPLGIHAYADMRNSSGTIVTGTGSGPAPDVIPPVGTYTNVSTTFIGPPTMTNTTVYIIWAGTPPSSQIINVDSVIVSTGNTYFDGYTTSTF